MKYILKHNRERNTNHVSYMREHKIFQLLKGKEIVQNIISLSTEIIINFSFLMFRLSCLDKHFHSPHGNIRINALPFSVHIIFIILILFERDFHFITQRGSNILIYICTKDNFQFVLCVWQSFLYSLKLIWFKFKLLTIELLNPTNDYIKELPRTLNKYKL